METIKKALSILATIGGTFSGVRYTNKDGRTWTGSIQIGGYVRRVKDALDHLYSLINMDGSLTVPGLQLLAVIQDGQNAEIADFNRRQWGVLTTQDEKETVGPALTPKGLTRYCPGLAWRRVKKAERQGMPYPDAFTPSGDPRWIQRIHIDHLVEAIDAEIDAAQRVLDDGPRPLADGQERWGRGVVYSANTGDVMIRCRVVQGRTVRDADVEQVTYTFSSPVALCRRVVKAAAGIGQERTLTFTGLQTLNARHDTADLDAPTANTLDAVALVAAAQAAQDAQDAQDAQA